MRRDRAVSARAWWSTSLVTSLSSFRDALLGAGPESIRPAVVMDSGLATFVAPRNDKEQSAHAEEIALADFDAVMPENVVRGGGVEVEIRQREMAEELLSLHRHGLVGASGKSDIAGVGAVELRRLERLDIIGGIAEPLLQLLEGLFGVGRRRHFAMGQPCAALGGEIAGELNLLAQRQHIREQPRAEQHLGLDVLCLAMRFGLAEDAGEAAQHLQIGGDDGVVKGHVMLRCWGVSIVGLGKPLGPRQMNTTLQAAVSS